MAIPSQNVAKLSLVDGRFRLVIVDTQCKKKRVRYPKIEVKKNRIRVGCITVSREAAKALLQMETGFHQAEWDYGD